MICYECKIFATIFKECSTNQESVTLEKVALLLE
jgi:hypothetical protein